MASSIIFPGFDHCYCLQHPGTGVFIGRAELSIEEGFAALRGDLEVHHPVLIQWAMGSPIPQDFIWTTIAAPFVVSDKVLGTLRAIGATGWSTYPVEVRGPDDQVIPGYNGLSIQGRCGALQRERAAPVKKAFPGGVFTVYQGYFFDERSWDGSDMFVPDDGSASVFAVQKVKNALSKAKVRGVTIERTDLAELPLLSSDASANPSVN